jgi:small subunit ribosomal protein S6
MATKKNLQSYELMMIFTPVLAEEEFKNAQKKITDFIKENGGEIVHSNPWGLRSLAYPIKKKTTGLYWVAEYNAPAETNAKLEIQMNRDENIMRHMITRLDKYAVEYNTKKRNKGADAKESTTVAAN